MSASRSFKNVFMPYCLVLNPSGKYTITNRDYKPLGMWGGFVDYEDYAVELKGLGPATIAKLSYKADSNSERIYLYNDSCNPSTNKTHMAAYLKKLEILAGLNINYP